MKVLLVVSLVSPKMELIDSEPVLALETSLIQMPNLLFQKIQGKGHKSSILIKTKPVMKGRISQVTPNLHLPSTPRFKSNRIREKEAKRVLTQVWPSLSLKISLWRTEVSSWQPNNNKNTWKWNKTKSTDIFLRTTQPSLPAKRMEWWVVTQQTLTRASWGTTMKTEWVLSWTSSSLSSSRLKSGPDAHFLLFMTDMEELPVLTTWETSCINWSWETTTSLRIPSRRSRTESQKLKRSS